MKKRFAICLSLPACLLLSGCNRGAAYGNNRSYDAEENKSGAYSPDNSNNGQSATQMNLTSTVQPGNQMPPADNFYPADTTTGNSSVSQGTPQSKRGQIKRHQDWLGH